ncbi:MAG: prepilin-type N-terminal cleavage/methylation domain-containing protein [Candidatus Riflebacteria bacterium]|nr:prepilin-type N-terminal cleavage/methylation domain-containing protein [Candidatus Riflebacteria bacterium]
MRTIKITKITFGFSLLEILIVLVIMGAAFFPILSLLTSSHGDTRSTLEEVIASNLASELIEAVQSLPFSLIPAPIQEEVSANTFQKASDNGFPVCLASPPAGFKRFISIGPFSVDSQVNNSFSKAVKDQTASAGMMIRIEAWVEWNSQGRKAELHLVSAKGNL